MCLLQSSASKMRLKSKVSEVAEFSETESARNASGGSMDSEGNCITSSIAALHIGRQTTIKFIVVTILVKYCFI